LVAANVRHWTVHIFVGEVDDETYAEAALCDDRGNRARGQGRALRSDPDGSSRPDDVAVASALDHLRSRLCAGDGHDADRGAGTAVDEG
jgi:hypothetical protein